MRPQIESHPIISKLIDAFGNWRKHRQEIREIRDLDDDEFANLAHELRISPADLNTFVRQGPHAVDELPKLLTALGIDEKELSRTQPRVLRDMVRVCASCQQKHQCDRDLDAGTSAQHYEEYCLNASQSMRWIESKKFEPCKFLNYPDGLVSHWSRRRQI
jgi:hypothetical protein